MFQDFKAFLLKSNAFALAIAVIIGAAIAKVVSALVADLLMPVVGLILPRGDWRDAQIVLSQTVDKTGKITVNAIKYGDFLGSVIDFVFIAFVVFLIIRSLLKPAPEAPTKGCPFCMEKIPAGATRCRACTSEV